MTWLSQTSRALLLALATLLATAPLAHARMALVVGEPFGSFGTMMPQGHASIYLEDLCADTPVRLRACKPGEFGSVVSRYHDLRHPDLDWLAFPFPVFLYGTENTAKIPGFMTHPLEAELREQYRAEYLADLVPDRIDRHGVAHVPPFGDWSEGVGAAFDRRLLIYEFDTTPAQDAAMLAWLNDRPNRRSYTVVRANCADFAADLLRIVLPDAGIHRARLVDLDMTTPKQLARVLDGYGHAHPELHLTVYEVPQLAGSLRRSRTLRGAGESLLTTKRYLAALLVLQPEFVLGDWIVYETRGKWKAGLDAQTTAPETWAPAMPADTATAAARDKTVDGPVTN